MQWIKNVINIWTNHTAEKHVHISILKSLGSKPRKKNTKEQIIEEIWFIYLELFSGLNRCIKNLKMFTSLQNEWTCIWII